LPRQSHKEKRKRDNERNENREFSYIPFIKEILPF
jgi:hypothetical protein